MTVTQPRGLLPILIPADPKEADGMTFLDGKPAYGRLLRESILEVFEVEHARQVFEKRYGQVADSQWAGVKASIALIQAMEKQDPRHLQDYFTFQALAETQAEEELVKRLSGVFKFPEAHEPLTAMLQTVRGLKKKTWSEKKAKLKDRTATGGGFGVVSELLWQLNRLVRKARFVMFFDRSQEKPLPAIYCPDAGTGLAAMIFNRVPTPRGLGVCRRPACQKSFPRMRPGQQYCSLRCGNADRKAQERARKSQR
jgi:hypothetical protein